MRRVIYTSKSLIGANPAELDAILAVSAQRNRDHDITGMLWSDGSNFAQVLEGNSQAISATMDRIRADPRHFRIDVVLDRTMLNRQFGNWAMVLADRSDAGMTSTIFLLGFAGGERTASARRLYEIVLATENCC